MPIKRIRLAIAATAVLAVGGGAVAVAATGAGSSGYDYGYMYRMMGSGYSYQPAKLTPVTTLAAGRADAQKFADRLGLKVAEVLRFQDNFYAKLVDSQGNGATEVLVDPESGFVSIEYGPAMMWNTRYGMGRGAGWMMGSYGESMMRDYGGAMMGEYGAGTTTGSDGTSTSSGYGYGMMSGGAHEGNGYGYGGMMGGYGYGAGPATTGTTTASTATTGTSTTGATTTGTTITGATTTGATVTLADARTIAQHWLDSHEPGVKVETGGDAFPGYYTLETLQGGKITGMISVNATSGAVWPHWWHGPFIAKWEA